MAEMDKVWWNHITKAHKFMEDIVACAVEGKSMILSLPEKVPWRNTLLELVEDQLKQENFKNAFEYVACPEEEVGLFLLNKYCKKEKRASYRYGITYAEFLGQCEDIVLNDRYIWVHDIPQNKCEEWLDFIVEYNKNVKQKTPAIFILEVRDGSFNTKARKGIRKLAFNQNINAYDRFAFCALVASDSSTCKEYLCQYLAELAASICKDDIELCAECVRKGSQFLKDPEETLKQIIVESYRSDGEEFTYSKTPEELKTLVWEAQLKNVFPVIEKYRSYFIKKYNDNIRTVLPISNSYGQKVITPEEVEIGMLIYLIGNGTIRLDNSSEYQELERFRDARNKLAHLNIIDFETVDVILKRSESI